uniref:TSA: Wollemia nobilis Ref_Wollemi_Transcript_24998_1838 transcribed RNA sequence n=1 Tax=Wollemia nobilis TaxID=56998 RepID=A0A0C9S4L9_9CONI
MSGFDGPKWDGLLKWSLSHADGTGSARQLSEEDRRWFMEAMQAQTVDVVKRMKEITTIMQTPQEVLEAQGVTVEDLEGILEELQEHVEAIDMANDLHSIGGLVPLLGYLRNPHASVRARAAEVVTTVVQNNPKSQNLVMDAKGLELLLSNFISDPDMTVRTKALGAISSLIRHNKPAIVAFRLANGYAALRDALTTEDARFQRKALHTVQYLLQENPEDCNVAIELGFPRLFMHLVASEDADVRQAALQNLYEITRGGKAEDAGFTDKEGNLKQVLEARITDIQQMTSDDLGAAKEERQMVDSLWQACYSEPSSLRANGLLVLPGEDAPPPDVASQYFEPPLRAWAAPQHETRGSEATNKQEGPVLLLAAGAATPSANSEDYRTDREGNSGGDEVVRDGNSRSS